MDESLIKFKTQFQVDNEKATRQMLDLKLSNDKLNASSDSKMQPGELKQNKTKFVNQAQSLNDLLQYMDKQAKGADQRRQIKDLKTTYAKEIERQKRLMKDIVNQSFEQRFTRISFMKASRGMLDSTDQNKYFLEPNQVVFDRSKLNPNMSVDYKNNSIDENFSKKGHSINDDDDDEQLLLESDQDILAYEKQLEFEKQEELDDIEQEAILLNKLVGDLGIVINEQDTQFNMVQDNQQDVKTNLQLTQRELSQAQTSQQRKKRGLLAFIAIIGIIVTAIIVLLVAKSFY